MVDNWTTTNSLGEPIFGDPVAAASSSAARQATVVMVSTTTSPSTPPAFGAYDKNGNRIDRISLAQAFVSQNSAIPNNCMACHGGSGDGWDNAANKPKVARAAFLPFDTESFLDRGTPTVANQREAFRLLNAFVLSTQPTPAITDLINGWYGGAVNTANHSFNANYVPAGWKANPGHAKIYNTVIKPHCRTCHVAQVPSEGGFDFLRASDAEALRALVVSDVCVSHRMPHAQQTMRRMWRDGSRAQLLGFFGRNEAGTACTP